jgi:uncharacterized protein YndB with AHSA1/START domain
LLTRNSLTASETIEQEMVMSQIFDAPPEVTFKAYIDPNLIPKWWGPKRFATSVVKMDVKLGGIWQFIHKDPDGNEYIFNGIYHEIVPHKRLAYTFEFEGMPGHVVIETVTFEKEQGNKTKLTIKSFFQTVEDRDIMLNLRVGGGSAESMDRLDELLKYLKYIHKGHRTKMTKGSINTDGHERFN